MSDDRCRRLRRQRQLGLELVGGKKEELPFSHRPFTDCTSLALARAEGMAELPNHKQQRAANRDNCAAGRNDQSSIAGAPGKSYNRSPTIVGNGQAEISELLFKPDMRHCSTRPSAIAGRITSGQEPDQIVCCFGAAYEIAEADDYSGADPSFDAVQV